MAQEGLERQRPQTGQETHPPLVSGLLEPLLLLLLLPLQHRPVEAWKWGEVPLWNFGA